MPAARATTSSSRRDRLRKHDMAATRIENGMIRSAISGTRKSEVLATTMAGTLGTSAVLRISSTYSMSATSETIPRNTRIAVMRKRIPKYRARVPATMAASRRRREPPRDAVGHGLNGANQESRRFDDGGLRDRQQPQHGRGEHRDILERQRDRVFDAEYHAGEADHAQCRDRADGGDERPSAALPGGAGRAEIREREDQEDEGIERRDDPVRQLGAELAGVAPHLRVARVGIDQVPGVTLAHRVGDDGPLPGARES